MRLGALLLGICGGAIGLFFASMEIVFQGIDGGALPSAKERAYMAYLGFAVLGLLGAALSMAKPRAAALLLLVTFIGVAAVAGQMYDLTQPGPLSGFVEVALSLPFFLGAATILGVWVLRRRQPS